MECSKCQRDNEKDADTCYNCGATLPDSRQAKAQPIQVKVVDIEMSFMAMVSFMVKAAFAALPAAIIVVFITAAAWSVAMAMFRH